VQDYLVIYEQGDDGVFAVGRTRDEVASRMAEALVAHLAYLREVGRPIPDPHTEAGRVAA
jgi:predicted RNase H-like HicB family nuclease